MVWGPDYCVALVDDSPSLLKYENNYKNSNFVNYESLGRRIYLKRDVPYSIKYLICDALDKPKELCLSTPYSLFLEINDESLDFLLETHRMSLISFLKETLEYNEDIIGVIEFKNILLKKLTDTEKLYLEI